MRRPGGAHPNTTDFDLGSAFSESARLEKNAIRPTGTIDAATHDDVLLCHVREKVIERINDIKAKYDGLSTEQRAMIQKRIDANPEREQSRAHETWTLDQELLRQVNQS